MIKSDNETNRIDTCTVGDRTRDNRVNAPPPYATIFYEESAVAYLNLINLKTDDVIKSQLFRTATL